MSVKTTKKEAFKFVNEKGNLEEVPAGSSIYVHVTDNGKGFHEIHGKILSPDKSLELGWQRLVDTENGGFAKLPSDTVNLLVEANDLVLAKMVEINPTVEFYNSLIN